MIIEIDFVAEITPLKKEEETGQIIDLKLEASK